jgi:hypothetical protein
MQDQTYDKWIEETQEIVVVIDSKFYIIKYKDRIGLGSCSIFIHF